MTEDLGDRVNVLRVEHQALVDRVAASVPADRQAELMKLLDAFFNAWIAALE